VRELSEAGKEELALALLLLKDFKSQGKMDLEVSMMVIGLADHLGVRAQFDKLMPIVPPMRIEPR
jgi:hypothetical protein